MPILQKRLLDKLGSEFFQLAQMSQDIFWIRSADFQQYLYVSASYESIFKCGAQVLYENATEWINAVAVQDRDRLRQCFMEWQAATINQTPLSLIEYRINIDGEIRWVSDSCFPIYHGRKCIAYAGVVKDITHKKSRLKELDEASHFFRYFIDKVHGVFWVKDSKGKRQIYISPSYETVWGSSCESLYANPLSWLEAVLPEDRQEKIDLRFFDREDPIPDKKHEFRFRIRHPSGEIRWIKDTYFPVIGKEKIIGFAGIAEDITQDVNRENELREAKENAEQANRTKSDFLAMMSHELRTPLNAILGMSQILKASTLTNEQRDQIDVIAQSGHHLLGLLNDLLDFAKLESGKLSFSNETINLPVLVKQIIEDLEPLARAKGLYLKLNSDNSVPAIIVGDTKRIRQILLNLIANAIKFTETGHVQLTMSGSQQQNTRAIVRFVVEDTGIGIEQSKLTTIFDRFQQVDSVYQRKQEGVGLGLSIVKELVEKMSGHITVSSEVGVGSQFSCIIPFLLPEIEKERENEKEGKKEKGTENIPALKNENRVTVVTNAESALFQIDVLIVEDNLINQKIAKIMLEQLGCRVDIASCGKEALEKIKKPYAIVFMDIGLPDMNGFEVTAHIRQQIRKSQLPIIATTAHVFDHDRERCFQVGMNEILPKPIMQEDLVKILQRWVAKPVDSQALLPLNSTNKNVAKV